MHCLFSLASLVLGVAAVELCRLDTEEGSGEGARGGGGGEDKRGIEHAYTREGGPSEETGDYLKTEELRQRL